MEASSSSPRAPVFAYTCPSSLDSLRSFATFSDFPNPPHVTARTATPLSRGSLSSTSLTQLTICGVCFTPSTTAEKIFSIYAMWPNIGRHIPITALDCWSDLYAVCRDGLEQKYRTTQRRTWDTLPNVFSLEQGEVGDIWAKRYQSWNNTNVVWPWGA
ncbi:hypothetical protein VTO73DRAFT_8886 [Trametes versicolor]